MRRPLEGKRIVVTRSVEGNAAWKVFLERAGAMVYELATIRTVSTRHNTKLARALKNMADFDWIIFTSAAAPRFLKLPAKNFKKKSGKLPKVAVIGKETAEAARGAGYRIAFQPSKADSKTLALELPLASGVRGHAGRDGLGGHPGQSILLLRSAIASSELVDALKKRGAKVADVAVYRTESIRRRDAAFAKLLADGRIDYITFASPSAVQGFCARVGKQSLAAARSLPVLAIGSTVSAALEQRGFKNVHVAKEPTIEVMIASMAVMVT